MSDRIARRGLMGMSQQRKKPKSKQVAAPKRGGGLVTPADIANQSWLDMSIKDNHKSERPLWSPPRAIEKGWTPSTMGEPCDRSVLLKLLGYRGEDFAAKMLRMFELGVVIEKMWQKKFRDWGILLEANKKATFEGPPKLSYEIDVKVRHPFERTRHLIGEIKSCNVRSFKLLPPKTMDPVANYNALVGIQDRYFGVLVRKYMNQLMMYLYAEDVHEGFLLFDCKDNSDYMDYYLTLEAGMEGLTKSLARTKRLQVYWQDQTVPGCTHTGKRWDPLCDMQPDDDVDLEQFKLWTTEAIKEGSMAP